MSRQIVADPRTCQACRACEHACALAHASAGTLIEAAAEPLARGRIVLRPVRGTIVPSQCRHCVGAPCIAACPSGAIARTARGEVCIDAESCSGAGVCVAACPFDAIRLVPRGGQSRAAIKCDLCVGRAAEGRGPACVEACPVGTLRCVERGEGRYEIDAAACTGCMLCAKECPVGAIAGERKKPHAIDPAACEACGRCYQICRFDAIRFSAPKRSARGPRFACEPSSGA
jgi:Fe-S-cluster-containing hydrogenase component 2